MLTKVVVPLDGSPLAERALTPARALAEITGASLLLMTASRGNGVGESRERLEKQAADLRFDRVETVAVRDRSPADAILDETCGTNTVACMSSHGRDGLGRAMLGSVAEEVLRGSTRPVLIVGPSLERGTWQFAHWFADGNLLAAIDGSEASEVVVPAAAEWASLLGLRAWVVQVVPTSPGADATNAEPPIEAAAVRHAAEAMPDDAQWEVLVGSDVAASLLDYAARLPATLMVIGTHGRTGLARVALGSVAMRVVRQSQCPVLLHGSPRHLHAP